MILPTERQNPWKRAGRRVAAVVVGLVAAFLLLELGLQLAALTARPAERYAALAAAPGERRILCIGDSFTYGVHLPAEHSYPAQLQALLDRAPGQPWRVLNLGFPGQNSAQVRLGLARNIEAYGADIVVAWVGANNAWSPAERHLWEHPDSEPAPGWLSGLLQESRALGALSMAVERLRQHTAHAAPPAPVTGVRQAEVRAAAAAVPGAAAERGAGVVPLEMTEPSRAAALTRPELVESIAIDYRRMHAIAAEQGARLVSADYPVPLEGTRRNVNPALRSVAEELGLPHVELEHGIVPLAAKLGHETLWLPDNHMTRFGNYEVARLVLQTLIDAKLVEERAEWRGVAPLVEEIGEQGLVLVSREGERIEVEVVGRPGSGFRIAPLAVAGSEGAGERTWAVKLADNVTDEERARWFGTLGESGRERRELALPILRASGGGEVRAVRLTLLLRAPKETEAVHYPGLELLLGRE